MQIISDGKINTLQLQLPVVAKKHRNEWEYYVFLFQEKINPYLISSGKKPWDKKKISLRMRIAKIKGHHVREFFEECEDKGYDTSKYNFYVHFFSKTKIIWKTK